MSDPFGRLGMRVDRSQCEERRGSGDAPPQLILPLDNLPTLSAAANGFLVTVIADSGSAETGFVGAQGIVAIGYPGSFAVHVRMTPDELRASAAGMMRCASMIDGGRGKQ